MSKNKIQPGCELDVKPEVSVSLPGTSDRIEAYRRWYEANMETEESPFHSKKLEDTLDTDVKSGIIEK